MSRENISNSSRTQSDNKRKENFRGFTSSDKRMVIINFMNNPEVGEYIWRVVRKEKERSAIQSMLEGKLSSVNEDRSETPSFPTLPTDRNVPVKSQSESPSKLRFPVSYLNHAMNPPPEKYSGHKSERNFKADASRSTATHDYKSARKPGYTSRRNVNYIESYASKHTAKDRRSLIRAGIRATKSKGVKSFILGKQYVTEDMDY